MNLAKVRKALSLLTHPSFLRAALSQRVAAATEHLQPIRFTQAATLIDVGANKGQFSLAFRALRPNARIIAFEPLAAAAVRFEALFDGDPLATLHRFAISEADGAAEFHVADREDSSSLLEPGPVQSAAFGVRAQSVTTVETRRLASCVSLTELTHPILMKVDVQGAELSVLRGCEELEQIDWIYVELSFAELYQSQPLFNEVAAYLESRGFRLAGVYNQVETAAVGPTQADFLFRKPG